MGLLDLIEQVKTRQTEPRQGTAGEPAEPRQSTPGEVAEPNSYYDVVGLLLLCFGLLLLCSYVTMGQYMGPISLGAQTGLLGY